MRGAAFIEEPSAPIVAPAGGPHSLFSSSVSRSSSCDGLNRSRFATYSLRAKAFIESGAAANGEFGVDKRRFDVCAATVDELIVPRSWCCDRSATGGVCA